MRRKRDQSYDFRMGQISFAHLKEDRRNAPHSSSSKERWMAEGGGRLNSDVYVNVGKEIIESDTWVLRGRLETRRRPSGKVRRDDRVHL